MRPFSRSASVSAISTRTRALPEGVSKTIAGPLDVQAPISAAAPSAVAVRQVASKT